MSEQSTLELGDKRYVKQKRMFSVFTSNTIPPVPSDHERKTFVPILSVLNSFFIWMFPITKVGYSRTIQPEDLPRLSDSMTVESLHDTFEAHLSKYDEQARKNDTTDDYITPISVYYKALYRSFKWAFIISLSGFVLGDAAVAFSPLMMKKLVEFCTAKLLHVDSINYGQGVGYALGETFMILFQSYVSNQSFYITLATSTQVKAVLSKMVIQKAFVADAKSRHDYPASKLMVLLGTDLSKIETAIGFGFLVVSIPVSLIITIVLLAINLGITVLVALGIIASISVAFVFIIRKLMSLRKASLKSTDARVSKVKEMVENLKILKYYSWEIPYLKTSTALRAKESKALMAMQLLRSYFFVILLSIPPITTMVAFPVLYSIDEGKRTAANVFSSVSLIGQLGNSLLSAPYAVSVIVDGVISFRRIVDFLNSGEIEGSGYIEYNPDSLPEIEAGDQCVIKVSDADFIWEKYPVIEEDETDEEALKKLKQKKKQEKKDMKEKMKKENITKKEYQLQKEKEKEAEITEAFKLSNINLNVKRGEFVMIVGMIGSGKTSLLNAITGLMKKTQGTAVINGTFLLCGTPWVQNATIQDNIIFGTELDEKKYQQTLYACALNADLKALPAGEATEVGEKGITLSGGQKARLNLARAVYAERDIYLLDDVLSAVDAKVGKHIMDTCLNGILKDSTRILATHQLSFLSYADKVVFVNENGTIDFGTVDELSSRNEEFVKLMSHKDSDHTVGETENEKEEEEQETVGSEESSVEGKEHTEIVTKEIVGVEVFKKDGQLIEREVSAENSVGWNIYGSLMNLGSAPFSPYLFAPIAVLVTVLGTFTSLFANTWLSFWTEDSFPGRSDGFYIGMYVFLSLITIPFMAAQLAFYVYLIITAAKQINVEAMRRFVFVPMGYIDITPIGRILNRFTKDTDAIDNQLVQSFRFVVYITAHIIGIFILSAIYLPWLVIAFPFLILFVIVIGSFYQATSREVKRLESTQRSLVYNNFNESVSGLDVIRNFGHEHQFLRKNDLFLNNNNEATIAVSAVQRWGSSLVASVAGIYVLAVSMLSVFGVFDINPSQVGLILSYVIGIPPLLDELVKNYALVENEMTSYERIHEYSTDLPQEAAYNISSTAPPLSWPEHGAIKFDNASMRYRANLPKALKSVSLNIKPHEKIGICGRTGAGKSTITSTLFRLTELCEGSIHIDGIDISTLGLNELRSKLSIIPQESILIDGTIRRNLDPFGSISDDDLWDSLRKTGLIKSEDLEKVKQQSGDSGDKHQFHLDTLIENNGSNISLGEKQLISFARALVKNSNILILDEATSSVDYVTDAKIQRTIREEFSSCTILCIAHRLRTILNYDKILVLDKGEVKEFDTPKNLFQSEDSVFRMLCDKSKVTIDDFN